MKISDAIEAGWRKYDQCRGPMFELKSLRHSRQAENIGAVCALGAASIAVEPAEIPTKNILARQWPELTRNASAFPEAYDLVRTAADFDRQWDGFDCIAYINDSLGYAKEEVLETVRSWGL